MPAVDYRQGDYRVVAERLRPAAERLVEACAPSAGDLVVDVAAGTGNVAALCAARGAAVVAVDLVPEQLVLGRADAVGGVHWVAGDAQALPLRDGVASAALSTFGVIFAPDAAAAAGELARVCRRGAAVGLTAWPAGGFQEASLAVFAEVAGMGAPGEDHIARWGTAQRIAGHLGAVADDVEVREEALVATYPSLDAWWGTRLLTPPVMTARQRLDDDAFEELGRRLREVTERFATPSPDGLVLRDGYLLARARVR